MDREYNKFWNRERLGRAKEINFTPNEIITLASIIINETNKEDEYRTIAGVYINRLNHGMRLQADPTVKFALGDFERQRILKNDTYIDSPYNTYQHPGLPPGPICNPGAAALKAAGAELIELIEFLFVHIVRKVGVFRQMQRAGHPAISSSFPPESAESPSACAYCWRCGQRNFRKASYASSRSTVFTRLMTRATRARSLPAFESPELVQVVCGHVAYPLTANVN